ncbi:MAG: ankyrin repeat domain-containing protein [Alphaproteobacteria bacterium]|nr:ankyrin repeat domain-containing protein [Alphaproteobacteria bacterium]
MHSDIEHLRASAKKLKKAYAAKDEAAIARLQKFVPADKVLRHADFLYVIARENGHSSWPALKFALEAAQMTRDQKADRLKMALYFGQPWVVRNLLDEDPELIEHNLGLQIATYDLDSVRRAIETRPAAATETIGVRSPVLHLAYSHYIHMQPDRAADMLATADLLVANGADVNDAYASDPGSDHRISALYGALGHANNIPLARWLLEHGANPDDNESLYHATELGHHDGLKLLMEFGVSTQGTNALPRALDFNDPEAVRLLLAHGADPNESVQQHPSGEPVFTIPALHQAARRMCSAEIAGLLLDGGADPRALWNGHTAYAVARIHGNRAVAEMLEERGLASKLSPTEMILAECAAGRTPSDRIDLDDLNSDDRRLLTQLVWRPCPINHIKALVAAGLDPNETEAMGLTPLHVAGWEGLPEHVSYFLTLNPDLLHRNAYGGDAIGTVAHGAEFCPHADKRDHVGCAKLLLEAGANLTDELIRDCGNEEMAQFLDSWRSDRP